MEFKVRDRVRIRTMKDLKKEFGENYSGSAKCHNTFTEEMEQFSGKTATISEIDGKDVELVFWSSTTGEEDCYEFSTDMLEPIEFNKDDLRFGDIITLRNNKKFVVVNSYSGGYALRGNITDVYDGNDIDDCLDINLKALSEDEELDVMKVERKGSVLYRRRKPEVVEMTVKEISEKLGYDVKIVKE